MADNRSDRSHLLTFGLLAFVGYGLVKLFREKVEVPIELRRYVTRLRIGKVYAVKFKNDSVEFKFPIENPNITPMKITAIVADVFVSDGKKQVLRLGAIAHYGTDIIRPLGRTDFDLFVKIQLVNEFIYLSKVLNGKWTGQVIRIAGTITANDKPWPIEESFKIA